MNDYESWIHRNPEVLASIQRGLKQAAEGRVRCIGSFAKYAEGDLKN